MQWKKINPTPYSYSLWRILDFSHSLCKQFINTMTLIIPLSGGSSNLCCFLQCLTHHTQTIVIIKSSLLQNLATELYTHITWSTTIISRHSSSLLDFAVNECNVFHTTDTIYNLLEHPALHIDAVCLFLWTLTFWEDTRKCFVYKLKLPD